MALTSETFLAGDWHENTRNLGGVLSAFLRRKFPRDTIKQTAKALDCTLTTATNAMKGHASERTLTKAFQVWPFDLALAAAEAFTGQTYEQHLEQRIQETRRVQERIAAQRQRIRALETARASQLDHLDDRPGA